MSSRAQLIRYDAMCRAIDAAYEVDEVKDIRDRALAIEVYSQQAKNTENERRACEIRLRAERKAGQISATMAHAKPGPKTELSSRVESNSKAGLLRNAGISSKQAYQWEKLAAVPDAEFEKQLASSPKPSTNGVIRAHAPERAVPAVAPEALWIWGRLRDFERADCHSLLSREHADVLATMTPEMLDDTRRLAPIVAEWLAVLGECANG